MPADLSLLFQLKADNADSRKKIAETRADISGLGAEAESMRAIAQSALAGVGGSLNSQLAALTVSTSQLVEAVNKVSDAQPTKLSNAIKLASSAIQGLASAGQALDFLKNLESHFKGIGTAALQAVSTIKTFIVDGLASLSQKISDAMGVVGKSIQSIIPAIGGAIAALGPLGIAFVVVVAAVTALVAALSAAMVVVFALTVAAGTLTIALTTLAAINLQPLLKFGLEYNSTIEQAQLGIATIISSLGELEDKTQKTNPGEKLAIGLSLAADQVKKLKVDAVNTIATFEQILPAFQAALGPGLSAGLKLDEIRKLTVQIVQAAGAIGLPAQQISQEVRSILEGTINEDARLAKILGITNEMVANWKKQGTLSEELNKRLQEFSTAGDLAAGTLDGLTSNLQEALNVFAGQATQNTFVLLKSRIQGLLGELFDFQTATISKSLSTIAGFLDDLFSRLVKFAADLIPPLLGAVKAIAGYLEENRADLNDILSKIADVLSLSIRIAITWAGYIAHLLSSKEALGLIKFSLDVCYQVVRNIANILGYVRSGFEAIGNTIQNSIVGRLVQALALSRLLPRGGTGEPEVGGDAKINAPLPSLKFEGSAPSAGKKGGGAGENAAKQAADAELEVIKKAISDRESLYRQESDGLKHALDQRLIAFSDYLGAERRANSERYADIKDQLTDEQTTLDAALKKKAISQTDYDKKNADLRSQGFKAESDFAKERIRLDDEEYKERLRLAKEFRSDREALDRAHENSVLVILKEAVEERQITQSQYLQAEAESLLNQNTRKKEALQSEINDIAAHYAEIHKISMQEAMSVKVVTDAIAERKQKFQLIEDERVEIARRTSRAIIKASTEERDAIMRAEMERTHPGPASVSPTRIKMDFPPPPLDPWVVFTHGIRTAIESLGPTFKNFNDAIMAVGDIAASAIGALGQGVGNLVEQWVLMGETGPDAMRKLVASVLAGVAAQAAVLAIFELAKGFAALFWNPAEAAAHFTAAALFGSIAAVSAVAGRAVAGGAFQQKPAGSSSGASASSSSTTKNASPSPIDMGRRQGANAMASVIEVHLHGDIADEHIVNVVVKDQLKSGKTRQLQLNNGVLVQ